MNRPNWLATLRRSVAAARRFCEASLTVLLLAAPAAADEKIIASGPTLAQPRADFGAGVYLLVWQDGSTGLDGTADIMALRLQPGTLTPLDKQPLRLCGAKEAQTAPAVAFADGVFLVVWKDFRNGRDYDVRGLLVDAKTGQPRGSEIELAVRPGNQCQPAVASDGKSFLVVWQEVAGKDSYAIRSVRLNAAGKVLDAEPIAIATGGTEPAVAGSQGKYLVTWTVKRGNRGSTAAALVDAAAGKVEKELGVINSCCGSGTAISHDGAGNFIAVSAREGFPNPWGWPGPGCVLASRVLADGSTPEAKLDYAYRLSNICGRLVPNVVDTATWAKSKTWDAGAPGGFPGTADGLWPNGWPAVARDGKGYLFAWVKGTIQKDRLNLANLDIWVRGLDGQSLAVTRPNRKVAASDADETRPVLVNGPAGEVLLLYEKLRSGQPRQLAAQRHKRGRDSF